MVWAQYQKFYITFAFRMTLTSTQGNIVNSHGVRVALTFDFLKISLHVMNAQNLKNVRTKFGYKKLSLKLYAKKGGRGGRTEGGIAMDAWQTTVIFL